MTAPRPGGSTRPRTVRDVMTREVVTVGPDLPVAEVARLLADRRIGGLPVVDPDGRLLGMVTQDDVLSGGRRPERPLLGAHRLLGRAARARGVGRTAAELMTAPAVSVAGEATLEQASRLMHRRHLRRLCVTDPGGRLAGIVTRGDLVRAFARPDEEIRREIREDVVVRTLWMEPGAVDLDVEAGVVHLTGRVDRRSEASILAALASRVEGVLGVDDRLTWRLDV